MSDKMAAALHGLNTFGDPGRDAEADRQVWQQERKSTRSVIEKLTAPPETILEKLERLGVKHLKTTDAQWRRVLVIDIEDLEAKENKE